jgi:hypothetical protein
VYDEAKYNEVVSGVRSRASRPSVLEVRDHFAGYFDELGLWVQFRDGTPDQEVIAIGNELLVYLNDVLPRNNEWFRWMLSLERGKDTLDVLEAGDTPRDRNGKLAPIK